MILRKLPVLIAALALLAGASASAQNITAPASSVDSTARAVVAIVPVDTSNYVTTSQLAPVTALVTSTANANMPWGQRFAGTVYYNVNQYSDWLYTAAAKIDSSGQVFVYDYYYGTYTSLGYTTGNTPIAYYSSCGVTYWGPMGPATAFTGSSGPGFRAGTAQTNTQVDASGAPGSWGTYGINTCPVADPGSGG